MVIAIIGILASLLLPALGRARGTAQAAACTSNLRQIAVFMMMYTSDNNEYFPIAGRSGAVWNESDSWDDLLSVYDGRNVPVPSGNNGFTTGRILSTEAHGQGAGIYLCPAEGCERFKATLASIGGAWVYTVPRTYSMNAGGRYWGYGDTDGTWSQNVRGISRIGNISHRFGAKLPVPAETFLVCEQEDASSLGGGWLAGSVDNPWSQINGNWAYLPRHDNGTAWNYLFCDGHVAKLDPWDTIGNGGYGDTSERAANGYWTRDPND